VSRAELASRVRFVLVRPRNPLNIGAAARAMANFGLDDLAVVEPYEPVWKEVRSAVGGEAVLKGARRLTLEEALADCSFVLGTTAARRRELRQTLIPLPGLAPLLAERPRAGRLAILFGSEKTGLTNEALQRCHALLRIPTSPAAPSMNLGQAVAVTAYELRRAGAETAALPSVLPSPTMEQVEALIAGALRAFEPLGYMKDLPPAVRTEKLRRMLLRWKMARPDAALLQAFLKRVAGRLAARVPQA